MIVPVMVCNPVVLMLHNRKLNRWHPILFWECPPPSGEMGDGFRWKSKGHHTNGFDNREEAVKSAMDLCKNQHEAKVGGNVYYKLTVDIEWDGEETPAMVEMFDLNQLNRYPPESDADDWERINQLKF